MGVAERKAREFQRREEDILAAALGLAGGEDWFSITMDNIAEEAEIGKGTIYKHFKSKDEVCACLVINHVRSILTRLKAIDPGMEFIPRFKKVLLTILRYNLEHPEMMGLNNYCEATETSLSLGDQVEKEFWEVKAEMMEFYHALSKEGMEKGIIARRPVEFILMSSHSAIVGSLRILQADMFSGVDREAYLHYLCDFILKGLMNAEAAPVPIN